MGGDWGGSANEKEEIKAEKSRKRENDQGGAHPTTVFRICPGSSPLWMLQAGAWRMGMEHGHRASRLSGEIEER